MCGIAGIFSPKFGADSFVLDSMLGSQKHRGPDNTGSFFLDEFGVCLGHNRLSLVDLTDQSNQPFFSSNHDWVIVFNGEIYNFIELKSVLLDRFNFHCKTNSDTEVLIELFSRLGVDCINLLDGMFSFCILNLRTLEFYLVRDAYGEKPLFYFVDDNLLCFASETKALLKAKKVKPDISLDGVADLLEYGYIRNGSIYDGVTKLAPGSFVKGKIVGDRLVVFPAISYSSSSSVSPFAGSYEDAIVELDFLLTKSISRRLRCDAKFGLFLSGGVDSSLVSCIAANILGGDLETYTLGFENRKLDESIYAQSVASVIGSDHFTKYLGEEEVLDSFAGIVNKMSEPIADPSWIPTALISEFAAKRVKACLSGDGADELFLGYSRYRQLEKKWRFLSVIPSRVQNDIKHFLRFVPDDFLHDKRFKYSGLLGEKSFVDFYDNSQNHWRSSVILSSDYMKFRNHGISSGEPNRDVFSVMQDYDLKHYLPNDILFKVDSASMAASLEVRTPFLNSDLEKFARSLPLEYLVDKSRGKRILFDLLCRKLPSGLVDRPKKGFGIPVNEWLSNQLYSKAAYLFNDVLPNLAPFVEQNVVLDLFQRHLVKPVYGRPLYSVFILLDWMDSQR